MTFEMRELVDNLKACDKGIEVWLDETRYVAGFREQQLVMFYKLRDMTLSYIRRERHGL